MHHLSRPYGHGRLEGLATDPRCYHRTQLADSHISHFQSWLGRPMIAGSSPTARCNQAGRPGDANHCLSTNNDSLSPPPGTPSPASIQGVHEDPHIPRLDRRRSGSDPLHSIRAPLQWPNRTANLGRSSPGRSSNDVPQPAQLQDSVYVLTTHGDVQGEGVDVD